MTDKSRLHLPKKGQLKPRLLRTQGSLPNVGFAERPKRGFWLPLQLTCRFSG